MDDCCVGYLKPEDRDFELGIELPVPDNYASKMIKISHTILVPFCRLALLMTPPLPPAVPLAASAAARLDIAHEWLLDNPNSSIRGTARHHGVSESTLRGRLKGAQSREHEMNSRRRLSIAETRALAGHAQRMQDLHFPLTPTDIRLEAQRIWWAKNSEANDAGLLIGVNWYREVFLTDNPDMVNKLGKGLDRNRATCASHAQLEKWYSDVSLWVCGDDSKPPDLLSLACSRDG